MLHNIKRITKSRTASLLTLMLLPVFLFSASVSAAVTEVTCRDGVVVTADAGSGQPDMSTICKDHQVATGANSRGECTADNLNESNCGIIYYLNIFINILSAMVGIVVTAVIIWGGIMYSTSKGDPGKISEGKKKIMNGITSLALFIFAYAFLQWVVPGGLF